MISLFMKYDQWAKHCRLAGLDEWPEPGGGNIWSGKNGMQLGAWYNDVIEGHERFGVLCDKKVEFECFSETQDLPPSYTVEVIKNQGDIRHFKEPV